MTKSGLSSSLAAVEESALLEPVEDFSAHWWGASRSFVLPWLYVTGVYDAINSTMPILEKSKQDVWDEYLKVNAFKASLWKISEGSFCAIYYAYENLLVRLLSSVTGRSIRVTDRNFTKDIDRNVWADCCRSTLDGELHFCVPGNSKLYNAQQRQSVEAVTEYAPSPHD